MPQWMVREAIRTQAAINDTWDSMDNNQPIEQFEAQLALYNRLCDWLDLLENDPNRAYMNPQLY